MYAIFVIALIVFFVIVEWKIYEKAGQSGWACLIPIYNIIIFLRIIGKPWWWIILFMIPGVNIVFAIWATNLLSKSFGKSEGFTVGLILLGFIFYPILGLGDAEYVGPAGEQNE